MKNKPTQFENNLMENARKQLEEFKKSGAFEILKNRSEFAEGMLKNIPKVPKITPIGDLTPSDKRIRKAEALLYEYTFNKKDTNVEDVLKALEIVGKSRKKTSTKPPVEGGKSYKYRQKCLRVYNKYLQLQAQGKSKPVAKKMITNMKKFNKPTPKTLKTWLLDGKKESKNKPLFPSNK